MASFTLVDSSTAAVASSNTSPVHVPEIDCAPLSPMQEGVEGMEMLSYLLGTDVIKSGMTNELLGAHDLGSNLTFDEFEFDLGTAIQEAPLSSSTVSPTSISTLTTQPTAAVVAPSSTFIPSSCFVSSSSSSSRPQQQQPHSSLAVAVQEFPSAGSPASYDSESESGDDQPQAMSRSSTTAARKGGRGGAAASSKAAAAAAAAAQAAAGRNDPGRNARMAKENRERKKQYISGLEGTIEQLKSEIKRLNADKAAMAKQLATAAVEIDTLKVTLNNQQALNPFFQALQTIPGLCLAGAPLAAASASASDSSAAPGSKRANNNNTSSSSGKSSRSKRVRADNSNDDDDDSVIVSSTPAAAPVTIPLLLNIQLVQPPK